MSPQKTNILVISNTATDAISGASSSNYINGNLQRSDEVIVTITGGSLSIHTAAIFAS